MKSDMSIVLRPITVVIVGGGAIAQTHAKYIQESKDAKLVAIIDPFESGKNLAKKIPVLWCESIQTYLASTDSKADLYMICAPSSLHIKLSTDVVKLARPKVILVEKPISTDIESGATFLKLAAEKGCIVAVGHHRRFHEAISNAKQIVESSALGCITAVTCIWACMKNEGYFRSPWRISRKEGGGPIWTNLIHDIDCLSYLVGSSIVCVWATPTVKHRMHPVVDDDDAVDEGAAVMLRFSNGVVGTVVVADNTPSPYHWEAASGDNSGTPKPAIPVESYRLFGSKGTLSVPDGNLWRYDDKQAGRSGKEVGWGFPLTRDDTRAPSPVTYQRQIAHLVNLVRGKEQPVCSGEDGLDAVRVCEAITTALRDPNNGPIRLQVAL